MLNEQFQRNSTKQANNNLIGRTKLDEVWLEKMDPKASTMLRSVRAPEPMPKFSSNAKNSSQGLPAFTRNLLRF
jgi:hypothetical protein